MIAVQTNDRLYLLNMDDSEFVSLVMQETMAGRNVEENLIPLIRARSGISFNSNDMVRFANSMIPEISTCFSQVGNRFDTKKVVSTEDLEFFMTPDGVQYSCEEAYTEAQANMGERQPVSETVVEEQQIPTPTVEIPNPVADVQEEPELTASAQEIPNPVVSDENEINSEIPNPVAPAEEPYIGVVPGEEIHKASGVIALPASLSDEFYRGSVEPAIEQQNTGLVPFESRILEETPVETIQIREEQKRAASQLDNIVRNLPSVTNLPEEVLAGMRNYLSSRDVLFKHREYAEEYLNNISPLDRDELLTDFSVVNALGQSHDMIDSLLVFPVHTRILAKKDLSTRFSGLDLINSTMVRVCPIGMDGEKVQSYVQEIKITSQDVKDAEEIVKTELKKQGKTKRSLSSKERYDLMEEALEQIYKTRKGSLAASRETKLVEDLGRHFDRMVLASKVYIPSLEEWNSYDVFAYDARTKTDEFPTPLLTQLQSLNGKTLEEIGAVYGGPLEDPFVEELADENNLSSNDQAPRIVKVARVDTSEEAIKNGKSEGLEEALVAENFLSAIERDSIIATADGYVLDGYCYDINTGEVITTLEYEEVVSKINESQKEESPKQNENITVYGTDNQFMSIPLSEISEEMRQNIVTEHFGLVHIPDYYFDFGSKTFVSKKDFFKDKVYVEGYCSFDNVTFHNSDSSYVQYDSLPPELQRYVMTDENGKHMLAGYYFDPDKMTFYTLEELNTKWREREEVEETVSPTIPNPVAPSAPETTEEKREQWTLPNRKFRQPISVFIPTVFSKGMTDEKLEKIPEYREFVTLSEDDMTDELKSHIRPSDGGYILEGYCFDYDQVKIITEEEYLHAISSLQVTPIEELVPESAIPPMPAPVPEVEPTRSFEPIIGAFGTMDVSMGGVPLGSAAQTQEVKTEAPQEKMGETLTDYVKEDGTYVDPTGEEWSSKDEYTLYKMLSDDQFLSGEEEKGKQF